MEACPPCPAPTGSPGLPGPLTGAAQEWLSGCASLQQAQEQLRSANAYMQTPAFLDASSEQQASWHATLQARSQALHPYILQQQQQQQQQQQPPQQKQQPEQQRQASLALASEPPRPSAVATSPLSTAGSISAGPRGGQAIQALPEGGAGDPSAAPGALPVSGVVSAKSGTSRLTWDYTKNDGYNRLVAVLRFILGSGLYWKPQSKGKACQEAAQQLWSGPLFALEGYANLSGESVASRVSDALKWGAARAASEGRKKSYDTVPAQPKFKEHDEIELDVLIDNTWERECEAKREQEFSSEK